MSNAVCPTCDAEISWTEASRSDPPACPFCGGAVDALTFASDVDEDAAVADELDGHGATVDPVAPSVRRVHVVEQSEDRLLLSIDAGGRNGMSLFVLAMLWNGISWTMAFAFLGGRALGQVGRIAVLPALGILLFVLFGAFLAFWAVKATFARAFVLIEKDRASVQSNLFGWKRTKSVPLGPASLASLEEAYKQNDRPVYRVKVAGPTSAIRFGLALPHADKLWTVAEVNRLLVPASASGVPPVPIPSNIFETFWRIADNATPLAPMNLAAGSLVRIDESTEDRLRFSLPLLPRRIGVVWMSIVLVALSLVVGFVWSRAIGDGGLDDYAIFLLPFVLVLLLQVAACVAIFRGRVAIDVGDERVLVRWHIGPLGVSKSLPIESIDKVVVVASGDAVRHLAVVGGGSTSIPLTALHDHATDNEAAGLVRWQLERLGHVLS